MAVSRAAQFRLAAILFTTQVFMYGLITYNYRMIAQARVAESLLSDFIIGAVNFALIRKIASSGDQVIPWAGYAFGGVVGTYLGILISKVAVI